MLEEFAVDDTAKARKVGGHMAIQQEQLGQGFDPSSSVLGASDQGGHHSALKSIGHLGPMVLPIVWVVAWALALAGVQASGYHASQGFSVNALRWMF